jgi:hypothetical protein
VVVDDFDFIRFAAGPAEANAELVVDPDAMLPCSAADELFKSVAGWNAKVFDAYRGIELPEFSEGNALNVSSESPRGKALEKALSVPVSEAPDHWPIITQRVMSIKQICVEKEQIRVVMNRWRSEGRIEMLARGRDAKWRRLERL